MKPQVQPILVLSLILLILGLNSCSSTKEPLSSETWAQMENVVNSKNFRFDALLAEPIGGSRVSRIDLTGYNAFMKFQGDDLQMELPYFGQRQVAQMGGGSQGIRFEGTATDVRTARNEKNNHYNLDFRVRSQSESFQCNLRVYSGMRSVLTVNSNQRNSIRYEGQIKPLD
ncbi:MAG: DUF4251 domain-containing protein [Bacteroidetes bacterium]|jgi:hypothetical protein|nr:MAG: DUF4251 domain-containing protein [Bacteroidota bacterium]UCE68760.1 MAG: DUF4251 domain-containing protein [Flavobacteriaceae bacterium]